MMKKITYSVLFLLCSIMCATLMSNPAYGAVVNGSDSAYSFNVTNCQANVTEVNCTASVVRFNCTISNYNFIDYVRFMIDDNLYYTSRNQTHFWYDWSKVVDTSNVEENIGLTREYITDTNSNTVLDFEEALIFHNCSDFCPVNWTTVEYDCNESDLRIVEYFSSDENCSPNYNDTEYCDYCTPDWTLRDYGIYSCGSNSTRLLYYDDYNNCCDATSLDDDCNEPYGHNTYSSCSVYSEDFTALCDTEPILTDRIDCLVELNSTEDYSCITYVRQGGNYLQTNPQKTEETTNWLSGIWSDKPESREQFTISKGIGNVYYTNKNLVAYTEFILGIKCKIDGSNTTYEYEQTINPQYKDLNSVPTRTIWAKENSAFLIVGGLLLFLALVILVFVIKSLFN